MDLKEHCGSQESSNLRPTSWQAFAHASTLHGLRFVFPYGQPSVRRLLWAAALLACLGLLALESAERLAYFLSYPHVTSVDAVVSGSLVFPAVTICNLNTYRFSPLTRNDLYHAGELMALLDVHLNIPQPHLAETEVLATLLDKANFTKYKPTPFSMREFMERVGHDLKEMMLYCRYQGQECSHADFKTVSTLIFFTPSCQQCSRMSYLSSCSVKFLGCISEPYKKFFAAMHGVPRCDFSLDCFVSSCVCRFLLFSCSCFKPRHKKCLWAHRVGQQVCDFTVTKEKQLLCLWPWWEVILPQNPQALNFLSPEKKKVLFVILLQMRALKWFCVPAFVWYSQEICCYLDSFWFVVLTELSIW